MQKVLRYVTSRHVLLVSIEYVRRNFSNLNFLVCLNSMNCKHRSQHCGFGNGGYPSTDRICMLRNDITQFFLGLSQLNYVKKRSYYGRFERNRYLYNQTQQTPHPFPLINTPNKTKFVKLICNTVGLVRNSSPRRGIIYLQK